MYKGSNKTFVFDINSIQNKFKMSELKTPSTQAFQRSNELRQKNQQSDIIKQSMQQPTAASSGNSTTMALNNKLLQIQQQSIKYNEQQKSLQMPAIQQKAIQMKSDIFGNGNSIKNNTNIDLRASQPQAKVSDRLDILQSNQGNKFKISQRSNMHDFRMQTLSSVQSNVVSRDQTMNQNQKILTSSQQMRQSSYQGRPKEQLFNILRPLTPIKENYEAKISNLPPPSRSVMDPDNNITFLDNGSRILNPTNIKTPPPPMWGEILEEENYDPNEDFYDHQKAEREMQQRKQIQERIERNNINSKNSKKLKKKIVYVYESDSEDENKGTQIGNVRNSNLTKSVLQLDKPSERLGREYYTQSKRGQSNDGAQYRANNLSNNFYGLINSRQSNFNSNQQNGIYGLPSIKQSLVMNNSSSSKPPLPSSNAYSNGLNNNMSKQGLSMFKSQQQPSSRQIRTGGFQKLPTIGLLQKQQ